MKYSSIPILAMYLTAIGSGISSPLSAQPVQANALPVYPDVPNTEMANFPGCFDKLDGMGRMSQRLQRLRQCRAKLEIFRKTKIEGYNARMLTYDKSLGLFDARNRNHSHYFKIAQHVRREQTKLGTKLGIYYAPYRDAMIEYRTKMQFVCTQVKSIRRSRDCR